MSQRGPQRSVHPEEAFAYYYNGGKRRMLKDVAEHYGVAYNTVRNWADQDDWDRRAEEIDAQARRDANRRLAKLNADAIELETNLVVALESRFMRRLAPGTPDEPNPDEIAPGDISIMEALAAIKTRLQLAGLANEGSGADGPTRPLTLEELQAQIEALDMADLEGGSESGEVEDTDRTSSQGSTELPA